MYTLCCLNSAGTYEGVVVAVNPAANGRETTVQYEDGDRMKQGRITTINCINAYTSGQRAMPVTVGGAKYRRDATTPASSTISVSPLRSTESPSPTTAGPAADRAAAIAGKRPARMASSARSVEHTQPRVPARKHGSVDAVAALSSGSVSELRAALESEMARADAAETQVKALLIKLKAVSDVGAMLCDTVNSALVDM